MGWIGHSWNAQNGCFEADELHRTQKGRRKQVRTRRRHVGRFLLIGYYTGTRHMAMLEAEWVSSPELPFIDVNAGLFYRRGSDVSETTKRQPPVRIPARLLPHLRRWRRLDMAKGITSVIHSDGAKLTRKLRTAWEGMVEDSGLDGEVLRHTLRHSAATTLMQGGMPTSDAAEFLGMSEQVLKENYFHHHPDYQANADDAFARARDRAKQIRQSKAA
jgi:integrase